MKKTALVLVVVASIALVIGFLARDFIAAWWHRRGLAAGDRETRNAAVLELGRLGSVEAIRDILALVEAGEIDDDVATTALADLATVDPRRVRSVLASPASRIRRIALEAVLVAQADRTAAEVAALRRVEDGPWTEEIDDLRALAPLPDELTFLLAGVARDPRSGGRARALRGLAWIGPQAFDVAPVLLEVAGSTDTPSELTLLACEALGEISPAAPEVVRTIVRVLESQESSLDGEEPVRLVRVIDKFRAAAGDALPYLTRVVRGTPPPALRTVVIRALGALGPVAVPVVSNVVASIDARDPLLRAEAVEAAIRIAPEDSSVRARVADEIAGRTPAGEVGLAWVERLGVEMVPLLATRFAGEASVLRALGRFGARADGAVNLLSSALTDATPDAFESIAQALGEIGPPASGAAPRLFAAIDGGDANRASSAARALGRMGPAVLSGLVSLLERDDLQIRRAALEACAIVGPAAESVSPHLRRELEMGDDRALLASRVIARLRMLPAGSRPVLAARLAGTDPAVRAAAAVALWAAEPASWPEAPLWFSDLPPLPDRPTPPTEVEFAIGEESLRAVMASGELERLENARPPQGAVGILAPAFSSSLDDRRMIALARCAARLGVGGAELAVPVATCLERCAKETDSGARAAALARCLAAFGDAGPTVLEALRAARSSPDRSARIEATFALARLGAVSDSEARDTLLGPVRDARLGLEATTPALLSAIARLGELGRPMRSALPELDSLTGHPHPSVRLAAARAMWRIGGGVGSDRPAAIAVALLRGVGSESISGGDLASAVEEAADVLVDLGADAIFHLLPLLEDSHERTRWRALAVLGRMGSAASSARAAIVTLLADPHFVVVDHAAWAIERVGVTEQEVNSLLGYLERARPHEFHAVTRAVAAIRDRRGTDRMVDGLSLRASSANPALRRASVRSLAALGVRAIAAVPRLLEALEAAGDDAIDDLAFALGACSGGDLAAQPGALASESESVRVGVALSLGASTNALRDADVGTLRTLALEDPSPRVRVAAASTLWSAERHRDDVLEIARSRVAAGPPFDSRLLDLIVAVGAPARPLVGQVLERVVEPGGSPRLVLDFIASIGARGEPADEHVIAALARIQERFPRERRAVARALGLSRGGASSAGVDLLLELLTDGDSEVRQAAARVLGDGAAPAADRERIRRALTTASADSHPEVRRLAARALAR